MRPNRRVSRFIAKIEVDDKNDMTVSPTKFNEKIKRIHKYRRFESKPKTVVFKRAKGRFFTKLKKRRKNPRKVIVKGFSKKVNQLKERDDYYNPCEKEKIWGRICKKGLREMKDFRDHGSRIYRLRDRYARRRSIGVENLKSLKNFDSDHNQQETKI